MLTERANAKINLFLDVVGKREDGYHEIVSVMQSVTLCDLVSVDFKPGIHTSVYLRIEGGENLPTDCRNLAYRAAELFLTESERRGEVMILLRKRIPMAAGLAGGSADAAAVLRGLNKLCGSPFSTAELCALGSRLGADFPFCIVGGCALCRGIGEELEPLPALSLTPIVIARRGEGVSTPWAYRKLDEEFADFKNPTAVRTVEPLLESLRRGASAVTVAGDCYNIFEKPVSQVQTDVGEIREIMRASGAAFSMMSGSGPSVFGFFQSEDAAARACAVLTDSGAEAFVCAPAPVNKN